MTNLFWDKTGSKWDALYNSNRSTLMAVGVRYQGKLSDYRRAFFIGRVDKVTKRIKPKWQLEKEQSKKSKRGTFDSLNDFANSLQEAFKNMSKAFHWGYNKKKSKDAVGLLTSTTTTLFENRTDEIRRKNDQLSKRLDELERKIKEG